MWHAFRTNSNRRFNMIAFPGFSIMTADKAERLRGCERDARALLGFVLQSCGEGVSRAQFGQDVFAWLACGMKRDGYFVEFGATDGVDLSNSYLLEKSFGWSGILAEPGRAWHAALRANRDCALEFDCVWRSTGDELSFRMLEEGTLSTLTAFDRSDGRRRDTRPGEVYTVRTISLMDMLEKHGAPRHIDYLSIDTEGSELEILRAVDFGKYRFRVITCEHNFTPMREKIHDLLAGHGYNRVFSHISHCDDWYLDARA